MPNELRVEARSEDTRKIPAAPVSSGVMEPKLLKREINSRFTLLKDCPREVARARRVGRDAVSASRLTLRWTILPGGQVADTQVVATARTDGQVLNCVKREMSQWSFSPPRGGPVHLERTFRFETPAPAAAPSDSPAAEAIYRP